jgi:DNA-binding transcriptional ArsR family regulator
MRTCASAHWSRLHARAPAERTSGEADALDATYPNISQHLNVMRDAGLVVSRRDGTTVYYRLAYPQITQGCDIVRDVLRDTAALAGE